MISQKKEKLDPDYIVVKEMKCKGNEPSLLPVRDPQIQPTNGASNKPKLFHEINKMKDEKTNADNLNSHQNTDECEMADQTDVNAFCP